MLFSRSSLLVALSLAVFASARPAEKRWGGWGGGGNGHSSWQPSKASPYLDFGKRWGETWGQCDINNALGSMNLASVSPPLPQPSAGLQLFQVAIGRGTQNYTCDLANATATPVPIGAVATLYNVSCIAADMPALLEQLPAIALDLPVPTSDDETSPINTDMSGHHYFLDDTTPFFNLDTTTHQYGMGALAKANSSDAPSSAVAGQYGQGNGAVSWLMLQMKPAPENAWKQVYRLNTAGGNAPKMCTGQPASFEVQYAAEYWLFK